MAAAKKAGASKMTADKRRALPKGDFALKGKDPAVPGAKGTYPIPDAAHARNALARVAQNGSPAEKAAVKKAVAAKFPNIAVGGKKAAAGRSTPKKKG